LSKETNHKVVEEKEIIEEEAHRAKEEIIKKEGEDISGNSTLGLTKEVSIITYPINLETPLNLISSIFSYLTLKLLEFNDKGIVVEKFYINN
jgi:hypothetical protein